ncbi:MAG TPA: hypothetical protein VMU99_04285 [Acidimicrobiales bacterium]|nr:hypothetical protein [Acidimicrobiales bacterium]
MADAPQLIRLPRSGAVVVALADMVGILIAKGAFAPYLYGLLGLCALVYVGSWAIGRRCRHQLSPGRARVLGRPRDGGLCPLQWTLLVHVPEYVVLLQGL